MSDGHFRTGTMQKELGKLKKWLKYSRLKGIILMEYVKIQSVRRIPIVLHKLN